MPRALPRQTFRPENPNRVSTTSATPSTHAPRWIQLAQSSVPTITYASSEVCARVSLQHGLRESNVAGVGGRNPPHRPAAGGPTTGRRMQHRRAAVKTLPHRQIAGRAAGSFAESFRHACTMLAAAMAQKCKRPRRPNNHKACSATATRIGNSQCTSTRNCEFTG